MKKLVGGFGLLSLSLFMLLGYFRANIAGGPKRSNSVGTASGWKA
jgi:hypothetical protein